MRLFVVSLMVFFGTLLAAGILALGEPGADIAIVQLVTADSVQLLR